VYPTWCQVFLAHLSLCLQMQPFTIFPQWALVTQEARSFSVMDFAGMFPGSSASSPLSASKQPAAELAILLTLPLTGIFLDPMTLYSLFWFRFASAIVFQKGLIVFPCFAAFVLLLVESHKFCLCLPSHRARKNHISFSNSRS